MIDSGIFWLRVAACLYALGLLHSILSVLRHKQSVFRMALGAFRVAVVLHAVAIVDFAMAYHHVPVANPYQALSLCAFLIALVFLVVEWRYRFSSTSVVLFPLVFVMTLVAAMERPVATWPDPRVRDTWLIVHISLVLAGYAALLLTAVAAVAYLIQERRLKSKQTGRLLERLPPLATLDKMISNSLGLGFAFITLGVVFGVTWAFIESGTRWIGEARVTLSLFTWILVLVMMFLRASAGWRGRKAAVMAVFVSGCLVLTWVAHTGLGPLLLR
jgi:ABC-type transport system involved in cytochrome c biogenesis permease subunit